jgi:hypothetical protein
MRFKENLNCLKYTDYGDPILPSKCDYRTSTAIAHRFKVSLEREFVPLKTHQLCKELKTCFRDYQPQSETLKQFQWKINSKRNHREDLAPSSSSIRWNHQFTDKVKTSAPIAPLNFYRSSFTDVPPLNLQVNEPSVRTINSDPSIEILHKRSHYTDTEGFAHLSDTLVSTTQLDYHLHRNYVASKTNLIVRDEKPFNADSTFFIPGPHSKLLFNSFPMGNRNQCEIIRDRSKFSQSDFDRIIPNRSNFVEHSGLTTEMTSNY